MSYAEIVLATVPAALPTEKNQRATSWPPPIEDALEQHPGRQHRERWRTVDYTKLPGGF